jgi:hypothetical protein
MRIRVLEETMGCVKPDPPSRCHLLRYLQSLLLAVYSLYASVGTPRRLASNTLLVPRPPRILMMDFSQGEKVYKNMWLWHFYAGLLGKAEGTNCKSWDCPVDYLYGCEPKDLGIVSDF